MKVRPQLLFLVLTVFFAHFVARADSSRAVWVGCNVNFASGISNSGSFSYQWQLNGTNLPNGIISTVAGGGQNMHVNGTAATNASLNSPFDVTVDGLGNLYFPDGGGFVFKVSNSGIITTVAGNGTNDYSGDGGAATNASLNEPRGLVVDSDGNLFIADYWNNRVRKVTTNGIISTVAGNGAGAYSGDGGSATNASLNLPSALAFDDSGNLIVVDLYNNVVRKVDGNGTITTVAGNGVQGYAGDGGPATNANLHYPVGVSVDASGSLFIGDYGNSCIRKVDTNGIITTVVAQTEIGNGEVVDASESLIYSEAFNGVVQKMTTNGTVTTVAGNGTHAYFSGDGGAATNAALNGPEGIVEDSSENLFIADMNNGRIRKVTNTQGPTLSLNNATPGDSGAYQVVVTGPGGSVTSSVASLIVATSPLIYGITLYSSGSVALSGVSQPGSTNVVLGASSLVPPVSWGPLATTIAGVDGAWQYTDTNASGYQARFYRSMTR